MRTHAIALAAILMTAVAYAADGDSKGTDANGTKEADKTKELIAKQLATYPLKTCVVTGGKLGEMGDPVDYVYKERLVRFCCKGCIKKFEKEPDKYLALIDEAAKKAAETPKTEGGKDDAKKTPPKDEAKPKHGGQGGGGCCP
jgi:hypothetical protein